MTPVGLPCRIRLQYLDRMYDLIQAPAAAEWGEVYNELRRLAAWYLRRERPGHTLQATALVHETWIRISSNSKLDLGDRARFFACAAHIMRNILVDYARQRSAGKRVDTGGFWDFLGASAFSPHRADELLAIDRALDQLSVFDPRLGRIVELKFFAGLSEKEIAGVLEISERTVDREWKLARSWLQSKLR